MSNHAQRRLREKNELRLKILDAAREMFGAGGAEAVTLRGVAERIEYSATTIYQHFADKDALLRELCAADFQEFARVLKQAERLGDPVERLSRMAAAYVDFGLQFPGHYRLMFLPSPTGAAPAETRVAGALEKPAPLAAPTPTGTDELENGPYDFLHSAVFKAMAAGCFRPEHRDVAAIAQNGLERPARRGDASSRPREASRRAVETHRPGGRDDDRLPADRVARTPVRRCHPTGAVTHQGSRSSSPSSDPPTPDLGMFSTGRHSAGMDAATRQPGFMAAS